MSNIYVYFMSYINRSLKTTSIIGGKKASRQVKWITCSVSTYILLFFNNKILIILIISNVVCHTKRRYRMRILCDEIHFGNHFIGNMQGNE